MQLEESLVSCLSTWEFHGNAQHIQQGRHGVFKPICGWKSKDKSFFIDVTFAIKITAYCKQKNWALTHHISLIYVFCIKLYLTWYFVITQCFILMIILLFKYPQIETTQHTIQCNEQFLFVFFRLPCNQTNFQQYPMTH